MTKTVGVALSGGAVRGVFHLGVLEALEEMKVNIDVFSGTSSGSIAGVLYLTGLSPREILHLVMNSSFLEMLNVSRWKGGVLSLKYLESLLSKNLKCKRLEELPKPLYVTATNINRGQLEVFTTGEIIPRVLASSSVPVLFSPVKINEAKYLDGGLMMNLPAQPIRGQSDVLIGVNLMPVTPVSDKDLNTLLKVASRTFDLAVLNNIRPQSALCDVVITADVLQKKGRFSFDHMQDLYDLGYEACMNEREKILDLV